ncbi:MAG TPA: MFS transporter [Myxococcales bacterium]|jgi:sugar phosphate permease
MPAAVKPASASAADSDRPGFLRAQREAFLLTWLVYVAFYLTRKDFDGAKPGMMAPHDGLPGDYTKAQVATLDTFFLGSYAAGHFLAGPLGDRLGARRVALFGLGLSVAANVAFGLLHPMPALTVAITINGLAQALGYPQCCKIIAAWFPPAQRGRASAWFLTSYTLGDIGAKALAGAMVNHAGWRWAFFVPAGIVAGMLALLLLRLRGTPSEAGVRGEQESAPEPSDKAGHGRFGGELVALLKHPAMWLVCSSYFILKMARYTFLGWSNVFLFEKLGYPPGDATLATIPITVGGLVGTLAAGYASDRLFQARRAPVAVLSLVGLAVLTPLYAQLQPGQPGLAIALHLGVGFCLFAADAIMSMATAMDLGTGKGAASAAGLINGAGSVGATLSPFLGAYVSTRFGWTNAWYVLAALMALAAAITLPRWNKSGNS